MTPALAIVFGAGVGALGGLAMSLIYVLVSRRKLDEVLQDQRATRHAVDRLASTMAESQMWYWTPEWQDGEREASDDLAAGDFTRYSSLESMEAGLEAEDRAARPAASRTTRPAYPVTS